MKALEEAAVQAYLQLLKMRRSVTRRSFVEALSKKGLIPRRLEVPQLLAHARAIALDLRAPNAKPVRATKSRDP